MTIQERHLVKNRLKEILFFLILISAPNDLYSDIYFDFHYTEEIVNLKKLDNCKVKYDDSVYPLSFNNIKNGLANNQKDCDISLDR